MAMVLDAKILGAVRRTGAGVPYRDTKCGSAEPMVPGAVGAHATVLQTRRGQAIGLARDSDLAFIVRSGVLMLRMTLPGSARQVAALLFPGDLIQSGFVPPYAEAMLVAAAAGEILRMRFSVVETLAAGDQAILRYLNEAVASRMRRQAIHAATLGQLDCEQRVATLLVELALRTGAKSQQGVTFDLPFRRKDIADYLGLNPDTLSRIMSRFRAAPFFSHTDRNRIVVRDFAALAERTPAAKSLLAMSESRT